MSSRTRKRLSEPLDTSPTATGLFGPEESRDQIDPAPSVEQESPAEAVPLFEAPKRVRYSASCHLGFEGGCWDVLTEPEHPLPRLVLASAVEALHPDQLPRLAAVMIELLQESRPEVSTRRDDPRVDVAFAPHTYNPNATAEEIPL